jgi:hypothetical protein
MQRSADAVRTHVLQCHPRCAPRASAHPRTKAQLSCATRKLLLVGKSTMHTHKTSHFSQTFTAHPAHSIARTLSLSYRAAAMPRNPRRSHPSMSRAPNGTPSRSLGRVKTRAYLQPFARGFCLRASPCRRRREAARSQPRSQK